MAAVAVTKPVDRQVADDGDQPGGEACSTRRLLGVTAQAREVVFAQDLTHPREHVHHVVIVLGVVADGREDEAPIAVEKHVPRRFVSAQIELGHPAFHTARLQRDRRGYSYAAGGVKT